MIVRVGGDVRRFLDADPFNTDGVDDVIGDGDSDVIGDGDSDVIGDGDSDVIGDGDDNAVDGDPPPLDADGDGAVCQHCGAENRADFRYCRWCVRQGMVTTELGRGDDTPTTRRPS